MLKFYNTLSHKKEVFRSIIKGEARIYACGPTVYNVPHIGNMRTYVQEDIFKRLLIYKGYRVKHIINITDVGHLAGDANLGEDKVRMEARKENKSAAQVAEEYTRSFVKDLKLLNILMPDRLPRATGHISEMLECVKQLDRKGYLYRIETGMYYNTSKFKNYGELTRMSFGELNKYLIAGARVERASGIKNTTDFAVWRFNDVEKEMIWDSEWGRGFPGWHIECTAMSFKYLGKHFDIHFGGIDHIPIHHTNEIAQSEAITGKKFVNYWIHLNFLTVSGKKMAKSLGNVYTVEDLIKRGYSASAIRLFYISGHYRKKLNFTFEALENVEQTLQGICSFVERLSEVKNAAKGSGSGEFLKKIRAQKKRFFAELDDDLNMPEALSAMHGIISETNRRKESGKLSKGEAGAVIKIMLEFDKILGLDMARHLGRKVQEISQEIKDLISSREKARKEKDFAKADELRKILREEFNIALEDTNEGVRWRKC